MSAVVEIPGYGVYDLAVVTSVEEMKTNIVNRGKAFVFTIGSDRHCVISHQKLSPDFLEELHAKMKAALLARNGAA